MLIRAFTQGQIAAKAYDVLHFWPPSLQNKPKKNGKIPKTSVLG
tara:strand:- start:396 stop:527 length:132 start_codon:yes stop_codon:yes gene_type:complete